MNSLRLLALIKLCFISTSAHTNYLIYLLKSVARGLVASCLKRGAYSTQHPCEVNRFVCKFVINFQTKLGASCLSQTT